MASNKKHFIFFRRLNSDADWGGTEVVLMNWFSKIDYLNCRATLIVPKGSTNKFLPRLETLNLPVNVVEYDFPKGGTKDWEKFKSMRRFFCSLKPSTIIFVQGWYIDFGTMEILAGASCTWGRVFLHENVGPDIPPDKTSKKHFGMIPGLALWWHKKILQVSAKAYYCKKILFVSRNIREKFVTLWKYPSFKSIVMYHGTETEKFAPSKEIRAAMRRQNGFNDTDIIIIATARLAKFKCLDRLIDAFDGAYHDFKNIHLLLIGTGPLEQELKKLASAKTSKDRIRFLGHVNNVPDFLKMSDIYVLSSDNEGLSLALMESMASRLICISTLCPGSDEIIKDGINGYLVEKNMKGVYLGLMKALRLSPQEREAMTQKGRQTVLDQFDAHKNVQKAFKLFGVPFKK